MFPVENWEIENKIKKKSSINTNPYSPLLTVWSISISLPSTHVYAVVIIFSYFSLQLYNIYYHAYMYLEKPSFFSLNIIS